MKEMSYNIDRAAALVRTAASVLEQLEPFNADFSRLFQGERPDRQPVHTVYGGAHLFTADTPRKLGDLALRALKEYAANFAVFGRALELKGHEDLPQCSRDLDRLLAEGLVRSSPAWLSHTVYARVIEKLQREPVEDLRIDYEDGFGFRTNDEEDKYAAQAALELAKAMAKGAVPPFIGIRIKPLNEELKKRSARTLFIFMTTLLEATGGLIPNNFVITLPKVTIKEQVQTLVKLLLLLEETNGLKEGSLKIELMVETTQSIISLRELVWAGDGRVRGAHFGTYDFTAECGITALHQTHDHSACDFARNSMKVTLAGTGIWLSDGATTVMPIGPYKAPKGGSLTEAERAKNMKVVHQAWCRHYRNVFRSLTNGFYQGWDLNPAQLPIRYAACYAFFLQGLGGASLRLRAFMEKAAQATLVGSDFDDAATGQGLLNYFLCALNCGAITEEEATATGLTIEEIQSKSFVKILTARRQK